MTERPAWRYLKTWITFRPWERHSLVLMIGGLIYIGFGVSLMTLVNGSTTREETLVIALRMFTLHGWGIQFVLAGALACLSSRWPSFYDSWGYAILCSLASAWSAIYLFGYLLADAAPVNITYSLIWGLLAFMWWAISGLRNPDRRKAVRDEPS